MTLDNGSKPGIAVPAVRYGMEYGSIARGMVGGARRAKRGALDQRPKELTIGTDSLSLIEGG